MKAGEVTYDDEMQTQSGTKLVIDGVENGQGIWGEESSGKNGLSTSKQTLEH
jgi:hypothetical protein